MGKRKSDKNLLIVSCGLVGLCAVSAGVLGAVKSYADDVVDQINITVPESCTVEGVIATGGEHTKTVQNNQYYSEIGTTTFKTYCNDNNGYAIYAVGYSNDEIGNTLMKHDTSSSYDFNTGTATSGDTSNWAMQLSAISGTYAPTIHSDTNGAFSSYHVVPSEYTKVVSFASNTDLPATGVNAVGSGFTSTYASWISATQVAGTYTGKVRYTLVHPMTEVPLQPVDCPSGYICYNPNGGNVVGTMGRPTVSSSATSATLLASNFSREGYGFAGWSKTYDYSDSTGFLGPQEYITFTAGQYTGSNPGLSLYAHWIKSAGNLQGWTGCSSMTSGAVTALTDQRDGETYAVAKLADGKCWMIENLRLENTAAHNSDGTLAQGYNTSFTGLAAPEDISLFTNVTTANSLYSIDGSTANTISGSSQGYRFPRYSNINTPASAADRPSEPRFNDATNSTSNAGMYSYGNYYTWPAAVADTTNYNTDGIPVTSTSICPSSWHLPKGGDKYSETDNEFWALIVTGINGGTNPANYNSSTQPFYSDSPEGSNVSKAIRAYPNNFVYSGRAYNDSIYSRGNFGYYWSSTTGAFALQFEQYSTISVRPGTGGGAEYNGMTIRCITSGT